MIRGLAPAICAVTLLAGCGGDAEDEVRGAVRGYLEAVAAGDAQGACARLTENGQLGIFEFRKVHAAPDHPDEACAEIVAGVEMGAEERGRLRSAEIGEVTVEGDSAAAVVEGVPVTLRNTGGEWLIDVFGVASDVAEGRHVRAQ